MKTSVMEVPDMLRVLTVDDVEKRFADVPGVESATANYAAGKITVRYDETLLSVADINVLVHQRGQRSENDTPPEDESGSESAPQPAVEPTAAAASTAASPPAPAPAPAAPSTDPPPAAMPADMPADMPMAAAPADKEPSDKSTPAAAHSHASS